MDKDDVRAERHMTFLEHLEELRSCLLRSMAALVVAMLAAIPATPYVMELLKVPMRKAGMNPDEVIQTLTLGGGMSTAMTLIFWSGLLISAPFITFFMGSFIFPGLTEKEKKAIVRSSGFSIGLFFGGVWLCYQHTLHLMFNVFAGVNKWLGIKQDTILLDNYISNTMLLMLAFGLVFQLPIILFILGYLGLVQASTLVHYWKHSLIGTLVIAMVLTPTPDAITMLVMAVPLYALYWLTVGLIWLVERKRAVADA
jgi:sec-independent protein translocase protein TatC